MAGCRAKMAASATVALVTMGTGMAAEALLTDQEAGAMQVGESWGTFLPI